MPNTSSSEGGNRTSIPQWYAYPWSRGQLPSPLALSLALRGKTSTVSISRLARTKDIPRRDLRISKRAFEQRLGKRGRRPVAEPVRTAPDDYRTPLKGPVLLLQVPLDEGRKLRLYGLRDPLPRAFTRVLVDREPRHDDPLARRGARVDL